MNLHWQNDVSGALTGDLAGPWATSTQGGGQEAFTQLPAPRAGTLLGFTGVVTQGFVTTNDYTCELRNAGVPTGLNVTLPIGSAAGTVVSVPGAVAVLLGALLSVKALTDLDAGVLVRWFVTIGDP